MGAPWNDWYHCTAHTFGTWLRGDPRGWRSRHHREHVEGDYKHRPPKGKYDQLHEYSKSLMKRDPVRVNHVELIDFILTKMLERLVEFHVPIAIGAFDGIHAHFLIRCRDHKPRIVLGIAKQYATAQLKADPKAHSFAVGLGINLKLGEGLWGRGSHSTPIERAQHFDSTFDYIAAHALRGAVVIVPQAPAQQEDDRPAQLLTEHHFLRDFGLLE
jgi:hypothetical protein